MADSDAPKAKRWKPTKYHELHSRFTIWLTDTERRRVERVVTLSGADTPREWVMGLVARAEGERLPESQGGVETRLDAEAAEMLEQACVAQAETLLRLADTRFRRRRDPDERRDLREEAGRWMDLAGRCANIVAESRRRLALVEQGVVKERHRNKPKPAQASRQASKTSQSPTTDK